jgi:hypothetical protein
MIYKRKNYYQIATRIDKELFFIPAFYGNLDDEKIYISLHSNAGE